MRLRPYQLDVVNRVHQAWDSGKRCPVMVMGTGTGKTATLSHIVAHEERPSLVMAHRQELVGQLSLTLGKYGVRHRIIAPDSTRRQIEALHMRHLGRRWIDPHAPVAAAGVDTLIRRDSSDAFLRSVDLIVPDEFHHVLRDNKWGRAIAMMPERARILGPTATPLRADGKGLGVHADGVADELTLGPSMRDSITSGMLTPYRIFCPPTGNLDLSQVATSAGGDFSPKPLADAVHKSTIVGDVVGSYLRIAPGKRGITFAVDLEHAREICAEYKARGVPAAVLSADSDTGYRAQVMRDFEAGTLLQLVNVDILGEGVDVPACEVVSFARPTQSFGLYCLDPQTEVLTPEGWRGAKEIDEIDRVVAFDTGSGGAKIVPVQGRVRRQPYAGESMFGISNQHLDICVSDNHDMVVRGRAETCKSWQKQTAAQVAARKSMFCIPTAADLGVPDAAISDADLTFLGWFLSDGCLNRNTGAIHISQSVRKTEHVAAIRAAIQACGFKFGERVSIRKNVPETHSDLVVFTISRGAPRGQDKHLSGWGRLGAWVDKSLPGCYDLLSRRQLQVLLSALNLGDGYNQQQNAAHTLRTLRIACGDNRQLADRLQALCVTRGLSANVAAFHSKNGTAWHTLYIKDTAYRTVAGKNVKNGSIGTRPAYERSRFSERSERPDFVWCLSNELGTLITRRNGKVAIVGNCQQFGRALRLMIAPELMGMWGEMSDAERAAHIAASVKPTAFIIDHVGNVLRHGLPDASRRWSLDRREKRGTSKGPSDAIPLRVCLNDVGGYLCSTPYERTLHACPMCGHVPTPAGRGRPEEVDGDLHELDERTLAALRGEADRIMLPPQIPQHLDHVAAMALRKRHTERQQAQGRLAEAMAWWGGWQNAQGRDDREAFKRFYFAFGVDAATARTLNRADADALAAQVEQVLLDAGVAVSYI